MKRTVLLGLMFSLAVGSAQAGDPPALSAIREADLKRDVYAPATCGSIVRSPSSGAFRRRSVKRIGRWESEGENGMTDVNPH